MKTTIKVKKTTEIETAVEIEIPYYAKRNDGQMLIKVFGKDEMDSIKIFNNRSEEYPQGLVTISNRNSVMIAVGSNMVQCTEEEWMFAYANATLYFERETNNPDEING